MTKPNPSGSTFAERAAAAAGESSFADPTPANAEPQENTTFAERAKGGKASAKQVDSDGAENKAVAAKKTAKK